MGLVDRIEELFLDGDYEGAKGLVLDTEDCVMESEGMNLMGKVFDAGLRTAYAEEQLGASKEILCEIARKMSPKEALITLLEQIEMVCLDNKLYVVLDPVRIVLEKLPTEKWETNLKWTLEVLRKRFGKMVFPNVADGKRLSSKNLGSAEDVGGLLWTEIYDPIKAFIGFYNYCLEYANCHFGEESGGVKNILRRHVLQLLGYPLGVCPFEYPVDDSQPSRAVTPKVEKCKETVAATVGMEVVKLLSRLDASVFSYQSWLERRIDESIAQKLGEEDAEDNCNEAGEVDEIALVSYFELVYGKNLNRTGPGSPTKEVYTGLYLASSLLENENVEVQLKALRVVQFLLNQLCPVSPYHRLRSDLLETNVHSDFISKLSHAFTYSDHNDIRRLGAFLFKSYMWAFDAQGRYKFINCILHSPGYSDSLMGFVITQLKEFARQGLEQKSGSRNLNRIGMVEYVPPGMETHFTGKYLHSLVQTSLKFTHGQRTDLVAVDGQVLSALNLIRFLLMRDGKTNISGIRDYLAEIESFLKNVRTSLDMTILQAKTRLKELNDPALMEWEAKQAEESKCEMLLKDPEGHELSSPEEFSVQEQIQSCKNVLTKMDLMECILVHTKECYDSISKTSQ